MISILATRNRFDGNVAYALFGVLWLGLLVATVSCGQSQAQGIYDPVTKRLDDPHSGPPRSRWAREIGCGCTKCLELFYQGVRLRDLRPRACPNFSFDEYRQRPGNAGVEPPLLPKGWVVRDGHLRWEGAGSGARTACRRTFGTRYDPAGEVYPPDEVYRFYCGGCHGYSPRFAPSHGAANLRQMQIGREEFRKIVVTGKREPVRVPMPPSGAPLTDGEMNALYEYVCSWPNRSALCSEYEPPPAPLVVSTTLACNIGQDSRAVIAHPNSCESPAPEQPFAAWHVRIEAKLDRAPDGDPQRLAQGHCAILGGFRGNSGETVPLDVQPLQPIVIDLAIAGPQIPIVRLHITPTTELWTEIPRLTFGNFGRQRAEVARSLEAILSASRGSGNAAAYAFVANATLDLTKGHIELDGPTFLRHIGTSFGGPNVRSFRRLPA